MNIYDIAKLCGAEPSEDLFLEFISQTESTLTVRFANQTDNTVIYHTFGTLDMIVGGIIMWHGALVDIPATYHLCDGTLGTPDLRDKFVVGAPDGDNPGAVGGAVNHNHAFTGDGHAHLFFGTYGPAAAGSDGPSATDERNVTGTTDNEDGRPPFYEIAYIMRI